MSDATRLVGGRGQTGFNVVIVDDRPTNRAIFSQLATTIDADIAARPFGDALEALRWLETNPVDLIITDYKMPGVTGAEFIQRVRSLEMNADVPAVVITAYDNREFLIKALEAGATDFLHSPVDPREFQTRVRNLLRMGQQQRLLRSHAEELAHELTESEATRLRVIRESRKHLAQVIDTVPAMISATDHEGRLVFVNAFQAQVAGTNVASLLGSNDAWFGSAHHQRSREFDAQVFAHGRALPSFEEEIRGPDGVVRWVATSKAPLHDDDGTVVSVLTTSMDITAKRAAEQRLREVARQDPLTGLRNRTDFLRAIRSAIAQSRRGDQGFAVHFLDLDRFKLVNDGLGHHAGDRLLQEISSRIAAMMGDRAVVARLGGDEFGILQNHSPSRKEVAGIAAELIEAIGRPIQIEGSSIHPSASIGIAMYPKDGRSAADLLRSADLAMYAVKMDGRQGYRFCGEDEESTESNDAVLARDLLSALARKQLVLHYQPQISTRTGEMVGAEALVRWYRPGWGLLVPEAFLSIAERGGMIGPISEWVLNEICERLSTWGEGAVERLPISFNVSPSQAQRPDLANAILAAAEAARVRPEWLVAEFTEQCIENAGPSLLGCLGQLRREGVGICVDNFGATGLSLWALQRGSVTRIKLDHSVVQGLDGDDDAVAMFERAVSYARTLGAEVAAVGVENEEQLERLRQGGCDVVQGSQLSKPLDANALASLLGSGTRRISTQQV